MSISDRRQMLKDWSKCQDALWAKWAERSPEMNKRELWDAYKHEWVEAYSPFVIERSRERWLIPF
jgi:hypothetical protein